MDLDSFRRRLMELQKNLIKRYLELSSQTGTSSEERPADIMDLASDSFEDDLAAALSEREAEELHLIRSALQRIDDGEFGICEECSERISLERLDALPFATLCLRCKQEMERMSS